MSGEAGGVKPDRATVAGAEDGAGSGAGTPGLSEDGLLGGRVRFRQFRPGFRSGIEPVLLAATVPERPGGGRLLDAGCGAGAALLCAGARLPSLRGIGIERDPDTAALARDNLRRNGLAGWDVLAEPLDVAAGLLPAGGFDHAVSNPPWHRVDATASPDGRRDLARRAPDGMLEAWCRRLGPLLRHRGTLALALPVARHAAAAAALAGAGFGAVTLLPLWPAAGRDAKLMLIGGRRGARSSDRVLSGLVLHGADGGFTPAAEAILRGGAPLPMF